MRPAMEPGLEVGESDLMQILSHVVEEVRDSVGQDIDGAELLYGLLNAPWLQSLLKVYECLQQFLKRSTTPHIPYASGLSLEILSDLRALPYPSHEARELYTLLTEPHMQALLSAHDVVGLKDYEPILPPLPEDLPVDEEAMRIVCLVKNKQPLGATIRRDETTGEIYVARVIHGGLADRSGLLHAGDKLVEVNGQPVFGLEPEQIIQILANSHGTVMFKVVPITDRPVNNQTMLYVRTLTDYSPQQDPAIPCADAGMAFRKGDLLEIVDQTDALWWQAKKLPCSSACAGLIPSASLLKRKQREFWWSQPYQPHTCIKTLSTVDEEDDILAIDVTFIEAAVRDPPRTCPRPTFGDHCPLEESSIITCSTQTCEQLHSQCSRFFIRTRGQTANEEAFESEELREEENEFSATIEGIYLAGFRRSMRLCRRRRIQGGVPGLSCSLRCPSSCYSALANPYEEVVRNQRHPEGTHRLIALLGPSGVGVNELRRRLIEINPKTYQGATPHTTRPPKSHEEPGREYHYISREQFENMVYNQSFVEYGEHRGHFYGTSVEAVKDVLAAGKICVIDIEPYAIDSVRTHELRAYIIYIKPPPIEQLKRTRINSQLITSYYTTRPFRDEDFQEMEEAGRRMEQHYSQFFDHVIVNDGLQASCVQLLTAVRRAQDEPQWVPASWIGPSDRF